MSIDNHSETKEGAVRGSVEMASPAGQPGNAEHDEGTVFDPPGQRAARAPSAGANVRQRITKRGRELRQRLSRLLGSGEYDRERVRRGKVLEATIMSIGEHDMTVDLGAKRDGIIPPQDLELVNDDEYVASLEVGDRIPVVILKPWTNREGVIVSLNKGLQKQDWLRAQDLLESGEVVEATVTGVNRGGVLVEFGRLEGFVPNSHLSSVPPGLRGRRLREAKTALVGQRLFLVVLEVNQRRRRLILSQREAQQQRREQLLAELTEGDVRTGIVRNLVDFGAFVDLGGFDGLIHISELDWTHVEHPRDVLDVGDEIEVYVLDVDREEERIGLSRKRLLPDPWEQVIETLHEGDVVQGTVTSIVPFGAFVDVGRGVEGLVHNSEIPGGDATGLKPGAQVSVRVLGIDKWEKQISLSLQAVAGPNEEQETGRGSVENEVSSQ